jgi:NAD(P)-dependent dehydrogenase (short-subunit alcohol dehydrogenase family)
MAGNKYAALHLKRNAGSIIKSSVQGTRMFSNVGASAYATSKAGQVAFTKMVALKLAKYHVPSKRTSTRTVIVEDMTDKQAH